MLELCFTYLRNSWKFDLFIGVILDKVILFMMV